MKRIFACLVMAAGLALGGCAQLTHFNMTRPIALDKNEARQVYVDAKQRVVFTVPVVTTTYRRGPDGLTAVDQTFLRTCAEASPDALSALAASASGNLSAQEKLSLGAAFGLSEGAASIGLRTQSIQMMRDAMYRLCEGASSGMLSPMQYETLQRRFQSLMVTILAIEQLTGAVRGPSVTIAGQTSLGNSELVARLTDKVTATRALLDAANTDAGAKKTAAEQAAAKLPAFLASKGKTKPEDLTAEDRTAYDALKKTADTAAADQTTADGVVASRKSDLANYQAALTSAQSGAIATGTSVISETAAQRQLDAASVEHVSKAVQSIVEKTLDLGFLREVCATLFIASIEGRANIDYEEGVAEKCLAFAQKTIDDPDTGDMLFSPTLEEPQVALIPN